MNVENECEQVIFGEKKSISMEQKCSGLRYTQRPDEWEKNVDNFLIYCAHGFPPQFERTERMLNVWRFDGAHVEHTMKIWPDTLHTHKTHSTLAPYAHSFLIFHTKFTKFQKNYKFKSYDSFRRWKRAVILGTLSYKYTHIYPVEDIANTWLLCHLWNHTVIMASL